MRGVYSEIAKERSRKICSQFMGEFKRQILYIPKASYDYEACRGNCNFLIRLNTYLNLHIGASRVSSTMKNATAAAKSYLTNSRLKL